MVSTGTIFFFGGIAGMAATVVVAGITTAVLSRKSRQLKEKIWKEYQ